MSRIAPIVAALLSMQKKKDEEEERNRCSTQIKETINNEEKYPSYLVIKFEDIDHVYVNTNLLPELQKDISFNVYDESGGWFPYILTKVDDNKWILEFGCKKSGHVELTAFWS